MERLEYSKQSREKTDFTKKYIGKYLPDYFREEDDFSVLYKLLKKIKSNLVEETIGRENISEGANLFIAKHNEGDDIWRLIIALNRKIHIIASETIHWEDSFSFGARKKMMQQLEMLTIRETFSNIPPERWQEVVQKAPLLEKSAHKKIATRKEVLGGGNILNIKQIIATLADNRNVEAFIDGPWSRLDDDQRISYAGYGLIAKLYKKLTKKDLNILPVIFRGKTVIIGEGFNLSGSENRENLQNIAEEKFSLTENLT